VSEAAQLAFDADRMRLSGVVDFVTVISLEQQGEAWLREQAPQRCRLDLGGVSRCNSAGTALLLGWLRAAGSVGKELTIENVPGTLRGMMLLAGLEDMLPAG
jgi:phospholipid transport system transporter-binding protein